MNLNRRDQILGFIERAESAIGDLRNALDDIESAITAPPPPEGRPAAVCEMVVGDWIRPGEDRWWQIDEITGPCEWPAWRGRFGFRLGLRGNNASIYLTPNETRQHLTDAQYDRLCQMEATA